MVNKTNFKTEGYVIDIIGKHLVITDAIQKYVEEKLKKVQRFTNKILDIINCRYFLVSFATKKLSGKKMAFPERRWFERIL